MNWWTVRPQRHSFCSLFANAAPSDAHNRSAVRLTCDVVSGHRTVAIHVIVRDAILLCLGDDRREDRV